jgi:hypothetical protein
LQFARVSLVLSELNSAFNVLGKVTVANAAKEVFFRNCRLSFFIDFYFQMSYSHYINVLIINKEGLEQEKYLKELIK